MYVILSESRDIHVKYPIKASKQISRMYIRMCVCMFVYSYHWLDQLIRFEYIFLVGNRKPFNLENSECCHWVSNGDE